MIIEYNRPDTIEQALKLVARQEPETYPLAGGSFITRPSKSEFAVVDLQNLSLNRIKERGLFLDLGATLTLQAFLDFVSGGNSVNPEIAVDLVRAIKHEATFNLRQVATIAGAIMAGDGRSPFITALLALDASLTILSANGSSIEIELGNFLPLRDKLAAKKIITKIEMPLNVNLVYEYTARSPADLPIVCAALCCWRTGRTRMALGGYGTVPIIAFDGTEKSGLKEAAVDAFSQAEDVWASSDYRKDTAGILAERCSARISEKQK